MKKKFKCEVCGICCKHINFVKELKDYDIGNGTCKFLDLNTNHCKIYNNRPDICNVAKMYDLVYSKMYTEDEYLELNYKGCEELWWMKKEKKW